MRSAALPTRPLVAGAAVVYAAVFTAMVLFERPGLGIGHFFYIAVALTALAFGPWFGAAGGGLATVLFSVAYLLNHGLPTRDLLTISTPIRLITFVSMGALLGWSAKRYESALAELKILAERDSLTGLPSMRSFEQAIDRRLASPHPFGLVLVEVGGLGELPGQAAADDILRRVAAALHGELSLDDDVARIGAAAFAVLCSSTSGAHTSRVANQLESAVAREAPGVTVGWASSPAEGRNALSLYRAADERLYARRMLSAARTAPSVVSF